MGSETAFLAVPAGLSREITLYLQAMQNLVLELGGYRENTLRAVRLGEMQRLYNEGKLWPAADGGTARDGETVKLGSYRGKPVVLVTGFEIPAIEGGIMRASIEQLRPENGTWLFEARAHCEKDDLRSGGSIHWLAIGGRNA